MKIKQAIKAGLYFSIAMAIAFSFSSGIEKGLISGLISGILFGLLMYLFSNSKMVKKQTEIGLDLLLPGEKIISSNEANFIIKPKEFGLKRFAFDDLLWTVGMKNKEAIGGRLHLTNYRLVFKSHKFNRLRGVVSIFLPTIKEIKNTSYFITEKITLETYTTQVGFIIHEIEKFIESVEFQKKQLNKLNIKNIKEFTVEYPQKCSDGLSSWNSFNTLNNLLLIGEKVGVSAKLVTNPMGALGAIFMKELIDESISEEWQKKFSK
jgi:GRAM domain